MWAGRAGWIGFQADDAFADAAVQQWSSGAVFTGDSVQCSALHPSVDRDLTLSLKDRIPAKCLRNESDPTSNKGVYIYIYSG